MKALYLLLSILSLLVISCQPPAAPNAVPALDNSNNNTETTSIPTAPSYEPIETAPSTPTEVEETGFSMSKDELIGFVKNAIIPEYKNWVLFENGTYVIFDSIEDVPDVVQASLLQLDFNKAKTPTDWDFSITELDASMGWSIFGNGYGIYTYVHPEELLAAPDPHQISAYAKSKRILDENNPKIIAISSANGIQIL